MIRIKRSVTISALAAASLALLGAPAVEAQSADMTFFVTSNGPGKGADLGGLEGADAQCARLAQTAGAGAKTWRAYLSTQAADGKPAVNARDRIGKGPWQNAKGAVIAKDVAELHGSANNLTKQTALSEKGEGINGMGDQPNRARRPHGIATRRHRVCRSGRSHLQELDVEHARHRDGRPFRSQGPAR
ncbi:hypothetical protein ABH985_004045 [Bradyrhizobium ottawaense]